MFEDTERKDTKRPNSNPAYFSDQYDRRPLKYRPGDVWENETSNERVILVAVGLRTHSNYYAIVAEDLPGCGLKGGDFRSFPLKRDALFGWRKIGFWNFKYGTFNKIDRYENRQPDYEEEKLDHPPEEELSPEERENLRVATEAGENEDSFNR